MDTHFSTTAFAIQGNRPVSRRIPSVLLAWLSVVILLLFSRAISAQIQIGTIRIVVTDPAGAVIPGALLELTNRLNGYRRSAVSDQEGGAVFNNVPFDEYRLVLEVRGFERAARSVTVRSNLPIELSVRLAIRGATETVEVQAEAGLLRENSSSTELNLDGTSIVRAPGTLRTLQEVVASLPGWASENDGLLHVRGVDDGILFVIDGVPLSDRLDRTVTSGFDTEMINSIHVITGNLPAEFGGKSGAVVAIQPRSGIGQPLVGRLDLAAGSFNARDLSAGVGAGGRKYGFYAEGAASRSDRFLDPVDMRNFHNHGGVARINGRLDWHPSNIDILAFNIGLNGSDFDVTNTLDQETASQHQRQELRDNVESLSWQRSWSAHTVSDLAVFHAFRRAALIGSAFDTPLFASQARHYDRLGLVASVTRDEHGHTLKGGIELARVTPNESFTFAVTNPDAAEEAGISDAALQFDLSSPFIFHDRKTRGQVSCYIQDQFSPIRHLTVSAGLRYDHSWLLADDQQFSPRIGAVYFIQPSRTAIRGSFNRLYMPPQIENLLLSDSEQARSLSPFVSETGGGARVLLEKTSAYEVGFAQDVRGWLKLDAAYWWRNFRNFDDPNVLFSTTVVFPNSVDKGFARGVDLRLDVPERKGWSGYLSYTNQRVLQTGPINGGLFLTDEVIEIGPGTRFIPDHDERNIVAFGVMYRHPNSGLWSAFSGRHESGVPLNAEGEAIEKLKLRSGADLVDFNRLRVKPWTVLNLSLGADLFRRERLQLGLQFDIQNLADRGFAYNFGNPFSGTHFGHPIQFSGRLRLSFR